MASRARLLMVAKVCTQFALSSRARVPGLLEEKETDWFDLSDLRLSRTSPVRCV